MRVKRDVLCEKISTLQRSLTIHHVDFTSFLSLSSQPVLLLDVPVVLGELVVSYPFQRGFVVFVHRCWLLSIPHLGKEVAMLVADCGRTVLVVFGMNNEDNRQTYRTPSILECVS